MKALGVVVTLGLCVAAVVAGPWTGLVFAGLAIVTAVAAGLV